MTEVKQQLEMASNQQRPVQQLYEELNLPQLCLIINMLKMA
jgi:hypothetical protein